MPSPAAGTPRHRQSATSLAEARTLADGLPALLIEARRVAATLLAGWHGRRRSGPGENFWQFRPFVPGEASANVDWRRSARDDHLYVREKEWEAAHTVWLWVDLTRSMQFRSRLAPVTKRDRAVVLLLALAELLAEAGERVGLIGVSAPILSRNAAERLARSLGEVGEREVPFETAHLRRNTDVVLIGDFLDPIAELEEKLTKLTAVGARAHLVQVVDPIEETFPYTGRTEFRDPETGLLYVVGRAEDYRAGYHERLASRRARLTALARRLDWTFLIHHCDQPASQPLLTLHARLADRGDRFLNSALGGRGGRAA
jgi:uncharacterized protein (DUF58 family)